MSDELCNTDMLEHTVMFVDLKRLRNKAVQYEKHTNV
jgi:hypothetical protein